jgi:hypothetical protein
MMYLTFYKDSGTTDHGFYLKMKTEVIHVVNEMEAVFLPYRGIFEIIVDQENPKAQYRKEPTENIDDNLLRSHILYLNTKLHEIASRIAC